MYEEELEMSLSLLIVPAAMAALMTMKDQRPVVKEEEAVHLQTAIQDEGYLTLALENLGYRTAEGEVEAGDGFRLSFVPNEEGRMTAICYWQDEASARAVVEQIEEEYRQVSRQDILAKVHKMAESQGYELVMEEVQEDQSIRLVFRRPT